MLSAVVSMLVAAAPSLAMPGLNAVNVNRNEAELYSDLLAQRLHGGGLTILTARDLGVVLGVERQKQLLGCAESSCVAELAGALGADGVIVGDVGKLESTWALNVKVLSSKGATLAHHAARVANADAMPDALDAAARALLGQLAVSMQRPELAPVEASPGRAVAPVPLVIGGVALLGGAACLAVTAVKYEALQQAPTVHLAEVYRDQGSLWQGLGYSLVGVGAAGLLTGAILLLSGAPKQATPTVTLVPGGASIGLAGVLP